MLFAVQPISMRSHRHYTQSNISCCCQAGQLESGGPTVPVSCDFAFYTSSGRQAAQQRHASFSNPDKTRTKRTACGIGEVLFFPFFQHFLQQYRRHRIHSFTNTKHTTTTTTTLVAVAVKKGQRSKLQDVEGYPVTALTIFILQGFKKKTKKQQKTKNKRACPPSIRLPLLG